MSYITPQTPPRTRHSGRASSPKGITTPTTTYKSKGNLLMTPSTTTKKLADPFNTDSVDSSRTSHPDSVFKTPSSILKKPIINLPKLSSSNRVCNQIESQSLLTPDYTPQRSPNRSTRKRKVFPDDIFKHATNTITKVNDKLSFGLLLPMPSTVGSGRKAPSPVKIGRSLNSPEQLSSHDHIDIEHEEIDLETPILKEPITPAKQLIDDDLVSHWHGKSFNNYSSDEELSDDEIIPTTLTNPFIADTKTSKETPKIRAKNPFSDPFNSPTSDKQNINYGTHMELIKTRTGERRVVKLSSRQTQIKPKKLDFSNI